MAKLKGMQIAPGMTLERSDYLGGPLYVESVTSTKDGKIYAQIDEMQHIFYAHEDVAFPRRRDGSSKIWGMVDEKIRIEDLCVGDIIPPPNGWDEPKDNPELWRGYLITSVRAGKNTTLLTLWHSETRRAYRIVSDENPLLQGREGAGELYGPWCDWQSYHKEDKEKRAGMKGTSGYYSSTEGHPQTRFREKGVRGRPPFDSSLPPTTEAGWNEWILQGEQTPHSQDPRYQEED